MVSLPANSSDYTGTIHGSSLYVVLSQSSLYALLALLAIAGNSLVIFLFIRHKTLRNVPNYLIVDLSVVDFFNSVVNIPFAICYVVLNYSIFRNRAFAWTVSLLHSLFSLLSLTTMALQMTDRYLAVCWPVLYKAKKSKTKLLLVIVVKWIVNVSLTVLLYFPLYKIDLGSVSVVSYRRAYSRTLSSFLLRLVVYACIFLIIIFAVLSLTRLRRTAHVLPAQGQNGNSPMARIRRKALYTILIVTFMCVACFVPLLIQGVVGFGLEDDGRQTHLAAFAVMICLSIPSSLNPYVFLTRVHSFTSKVKELKGTLCGHGHEESETSLGQTGQGRSLSGTDIAEVVQIETIEHPIGLTPARSMSLSDRDFCPYLNPERSTNNRRKSI